MDVRQYWKKVAAIASGDDVSLPDSDVPSIAPNLMRGYLSSVYILGVQVVEYLDDYGEFEEAPVDTCRSLNELVVLLEKNLNIKMTPYSTDTFAPSIGEVHRKVQQLKAFLVGCYSLDQIK